MQTPTRLLCLLLCLDRLNFASAAQKAVRLEVGFDPGFYSPNGTTDYRGMQLISVAPSYFVALSLGTPPQPLNATLVMDSSDLFVMNVTTHVCRDAQGASNCTGFNSYNSAASTSAITLTTSYVGPFVADTMSLGGARLYNQTFELYPTDRTDRACLLGLSPGIQSYPSSTAGLYPSLMSSLVMQEKINSQAFSLWLNTNSASTGLLVFGGVDAAAYQAPLVTTPMLTDGSSSSRFAIAWTGLTITAPNGTLLTGFVADNFSMAAWFEPDSEFLALPSDVFRSISGALGLTPLDIPLNVFWQMPCTNSGSLTLQFAGPAGPKITMPFPGLLLDLYDEDYKPKMLNGSRMCQLKLYPSDSTNLGTVFFNSAYVVIDYDQGQVSLALGNRNISGSNVREIAAGPRGVPGVASTATGPLPSKFQLVVAATSSSLSPTHTPNGAGYLAAAMLYKVVAVMLVIAV